MKTVRFALLALLCVCNRLPAQQESPKETTAPLSPLTEDERIIHVLNRFAFGATPGMIAQVKQQGLEAWFEQQLADTVPASVELAFLLRNHESLGLTTREILKEYNPKLPPKATRKQRRDQNRRRNRPKRELREAVLFRAILATNQVKETAADFFRQHFNVTADKNQCRYFATTYERDVIRAEAFGSFGEMLMKSAKHPAMLIYLDNALSRKPPTKHDLKVVARKVRQRTKSKRLARESVEIAKQRGLNENYARELLELHTLGVDKFYTQKDVINVAKALTGWTIQTNVKKPVAFEFRKDMHQEGSKYFLGRVVPERKKNGVREGEIILERLIRHRGTAHFIAFKLCRHFVNDEPDPKMVKRIAAAYQSSSGDLPAVYRAIFEDPEFFNRRNYRAKFKRPFEFLASAIRAVGAEVTGAEGLLRMLAQLNEPLYACEDPTGYYDHAEAWRDPGVMAIRWDCAIQIAGNRFKGIRLPEGFYAKYLSPEDGPGQWKNALAELVLPGGMSARTSAALDEAIFRSLRKAKRPNMKRLGPLILSLLLGSPDFQRQ